jgi:3-oxoadipate enol-lactonase
MPQIKRAGQPALHYTVDDFTDPWRKAPVLLLQHGNGRNGGFWYRWIPYLARWYRVVRPDLRGLGESGRDFDLATELTLDALVGDLHAVLGDLGAADVHYCGESMGGILGLALAAAAPARVRTLTLVATPVFISERMKSRYALGHDSRLDAMRAMGIREWVRATTRGTRLPEAEQPDLFDWYVEAFTRGDPEVQIAMSALVNRADARALLPAVRCTVLGLYPTGGQITDAAQERMLREHLAHFELVHLPTAFHMIHLLHARECAERVLAFCARHDGFAVGEP